MARAAGQVRLRDGGYYYGRVEIYCDGQWGTVCDDFWESQDANVVCRQLGILSAVAARGSFCSMELNTLVTRQDWSTAPMKDGIYMTSPLPWETNGGVRLMGGSRSNEGQYGRVRLADGSVPTEGRVEIFYNNEWRTICDDHWQREDAEVICRQLGYSDVDELYDKAYFGEGYGPIMEQMNCDGDEAHWQQCSYNTWNTPYCEHYEDVGVRCLSESPIEGSLRLVDGYSVYSGRIEIYHYGEWGTVCDDDWEEDDAQVACRQLGYPTVDSYGGSANYGEGSGPIMLDDVRCDGSEYMLTQGSHNGWYQHNCEHGEDAWVNCQIPGSDMVDILRLVVNGARDRFQT
ncbi:neurotrypsin-like [Apostichopus japonicus]|uniref:neurotrypsin-like n=1 Tax=Stichopus japonicus TaxID=307972 RepID=UPI003AB5BF53